MEEIADARIVLVTMPAGDPSQGLAGEIARELARELVSRGLCACANLLPGITSVYRWQGELCEDQEVLCVLKTRRERIPELERFLEQEHPYDVPECVVLQPEHVEAKYLSWLLGEASGETLGKPSKEPQ